MARPKLKDRKWVKWVAGAVTAVLFVVSILIIISPPDAEPDTPSEILCEPPLENYNSVCSCGPEKELRKQPGGEMICAPMNT